MFFWRLTRWNGGSFIAMSNFRSFSTMLSNDPLGADKILRFVFRCRARHVKNVAIDVYSKSDGTKSLKSLAPFRCPLADAKKHGAKKVGGKGSMVDGRIAG